MPRWVPALALALALVEVVVLIRFAAWVGAAVTVAVLVASALLAVMVLVRLRQRPGERGLDLLSALLLLLPGLFSSLSGLALLVPPVRSAVRVRWWAWLRRSGVAPDLPRHTVIVAEPLEQHDAPPGSRTTGGASELGASEPGEGVRDPRDPDT